MPRLSSAFVVAVIALSAISTVDALSIPTSTERVYSRHFARHQPVPRTNHQHGDVAITGVELTGKAAVAGVDMQGASSSEPQKRSDAVNENRAVAAGSEIHEGVVVSPTTESNSGSKDSVKLGYRSFGNAAKSLEHAGKAVEGATVIGAVAEGVESRSLGDHPESVSLGKRRKPKKKKAPAPAKVETPKEAPKSTEVKEEPPKPKPAEPKDEPKPASTESKEEPNPTDSKEEPKPASGTNKHDVAVAGFQAAGNVALAVAGMQGSGGGTSTPPDST